MARGRTPGWRMAQVLPGLVLWAAAGSGCAALEGSVCTPADTTYGCCLKTHLENPQVCGGPAGQQALVAGGGAGGGAGSGGMLVAAAAGLATVLESDDQGQLDKLEQELDEVMEKCARSAEAVVNGRRLGGRSPTRAECEKVVGKDRKGRKVKWRAELGKEKHAEAQRCVAALLGERWAGLFSLEQRYRYDRESKRLEPLSREEVEELLAQGRGEELVGTLEPDLVVHTGNLTQVKFLYDFKFPCPPDNLPTWTVYEDPPYRDRTQGEIYEEAFGVDAARVSPRDGVIRR